MDGPNRAKQTADAQSQIRATNAKLIAGGTPAAAVIGAMQIEIDRMRGAQRAENGVQALRECDGLQSELAALYGAKIE